MGHSIPVKIQYKIAYFIDLTSIKGFVTDLLDIIIFSHVDLNEK